jgi:hypothetical protein
MVLLFVVCDWREEAVAGVFLRTYLVNSTYVFLCTRATISIFIVKPTVLMRCNNVRTRELNCYRQTSTTMANGRQQEIYIFYLDEVCASFILVLVVQIVHMKKPQLTSKQNREQIYVGTVQGPSP